jgi:hypothetical protein
MTTEPSNRTREHSSPSSKRTPRFSGPSVAQPSGLLQPPVEPPKPPPGPPVPIVRTIQSQLTDISPQEHELEREVQLLTRWFRSPGLLGRTLQVLAHYAETSAEPRRTEDYAMLLLISAARARARRGNS